MALVPRTNVFSQANWFFNAVQTALDISAEYVKNWKTYPFTVFLPETGTPAEWEEFVVDRQIPYSFWDRPEPAVVESLKVDELLEVLNVLSENGDIQNVTEMIVYAKRDDQWSNLIRHMPIKNIQVQTNNRIIGVPYDLYVQIQKRNMIPVKPIDFISNYEVVPMSEEYWYRRCMAIENKFWPKNQIKVYCIPNVNYEFLNDRDIRPGSTVVDLSNFKIWELFGLQMGIDITLANTSNYDHNVFATINMAHLANMPSICPCKALRDEDGFMRLYFVNIDPVALKGFLDFFCIANETLNKTSRTYGISTDVYTLMAIVRPDILSAPLDWKNEANQKLLLQYILMGVLMNSKYFLELVHKNVLSNLEKEQVKRLKSYLAGYYKAITAEQLREIGL